MKKLFLQRIIFVIIIFLSFQECTAQETSTCSTEKIVIPDNWRDQFNEQEELEKFANEGLEHERLISLSAICGENEECIKKAFAENPTPVIIWGSGVDHSHPELVGKILRPYQLFKDDDDIDIEKIRAFHTHYIDYSQEIKEDSQYPYEKEDYIYGHETGVAGIVVNGTENIAIIPIQNYFLHSSYETGMVDLMPEMAEKKQKAIDDMKEAIGRAYKNGARIVNMSFQDLFGSDFYVLKQQRELVEGNNDVLFVMAAGNAGNDIKIEYCEVLCKEAGYLHYCSPFLKNLMLVASVGENGRLSEFSNYGNETVDLAAIGENVEILAPSQGNYVSYVANGTSFAAPVVTGVAAQIKNEYPQVEVEQIIDILCRSVDKTEELIEKTRCSGIVNEQRALEIAREELN